MEEQDWDASPENNGEDVSRGVQDSDNRSDSEDARLDYSKFGPPSPEHQNRYGSMLSLTDTTKQVFSSHLHSSQQFTPDNFSHDETPGDRAPRSHKIAIVVPQVERDWEYRVYDEELVVDRVLRKSRISRPTQYLVRLTSGQKLKITVANLRRLTGGSRALELFVVASSGSSQGSDSFDSDTITVKATRRLQRQDFRPNSSADTSGDELTTSKSTRYLDDDMQRFRLTLPNPARNGIPTKDGIPVIPLSTSGSRGDETAEESEDYDQRQSKRRLRPSTRTSSRVKSSRRPNYVDAMAEDEPEDPLDGAASSRLRKRKLSAAEESDHQETRRSTRGGRAHKQILEIGEDDIPDRDVTVTDARAIGAKEIFKSLYHDDSDFRAFHRTICDACGEIGDSREKGVLVFCQGCDRCYHQVCLGHRASRDHLVTKVGPDEFVLQCRRCVDFARRKDAKAPRLGRCQVCRVQGPSCTPFRERKAPGEEQKQHEENGGEDPVVMISRDLVNQANNVFFRCLTCHRPFHFHHLPSRSNDDILTISDDREMADKRFYEYLKDWQCKECFDAPEKLESLIAWRPSNMETYSEGQLAEDIDEDDKEYLIKWKDKSYNRSTWQSGAWVFGVTNASARKAFGKRDEEMNLLKWKFEDAIPEDYLRVDIVFEVHYTSKVDYRQLALDKERITEVAEARVKYKGLGYEDVVWEEPPVAADAERYADFKAAYDDWVDAKYIRPPPNIHATMKKVRTKDFETKILVQKQPASLSGGELREHQMEGINWLLFQWYRRQNAVLGDEMGLGKTIQIVGFLTVLIENHRCWPFLIVVPNSTCANWRREIKKWAPSLRVVMYFGSSTARELSRKYEMFPEGAKDLKCHIVVTSYETAQDSGWQRCFRRVNWAALIVDEGQKLKNDRSLLYLALSKLSIPFKVLLTGTPLQNNQRELFNLLQFLDPSLNAQSLEEQFPSVTKDNATELHDMVRPFLLRRTKTEVLKDLPPIVRKVVPVTLSPLQKSLFKVIHERNAVIFKAVFSDKRSTTISGVRNIMMELRKCLCHPFVYNPSIEDKNPDATISHRALVEAGSKLGLLEIMLPKLKERGHRVLIFSQFLDMLTIIEDFLDGIGLQHVRIDGNLGSLEKQKRIDKFNEEDSPLFACLLSTRAGGTGINLATADTVIILDPDFNPHQDTQAASRAHRMGQKNKVLVLRLMTRGTVEEEIMKLGNSKMALNRVIIEQIGTEEPDDKDLKSILQRGAQALYRNQESDDGVNYEYDSSSVDKLLDRDETQNTDASQGDASETQFSFARVWVNAEGTVDDDIGNAENENRPLDPSFWDKIIENHHREVEEEKKRQAESEGRGMRQRKTVHYTESGPIDNEVDTAARADGDSDKEFQAQAAESEPDDSAGEGEGDLDVQDIDVQELQSVSRRKSRGSLSSRKAAPRNDAPPIVEQQGQRLENLPLSRPEHNVKPRKRVDVKRAARLAASETIDASSDTCLVCGDFHRTGYCPLKLASIEKCQLCGIAHMAGKRACPMLINAGGGKPLTADSLKKAVEMARESVRKETANEDPKKKNPAKRQRREEDPQRKAERKGKRKEKLKGKREEKRDGPLSEQEAAVLVAQRKAAMSNRTVAPPNGSLQISQSQAGPVNRSHQNLPGDTSGGVDPPRNANQNQGYDTFSYQPGSAVGYRSLDGQMHAELDKDPAVSRYWTPAYDILGSPSYGYPNGTTPSSTAAQYPSAIAQSYAQLGTPTNSYPAASNSYAQPAASAQGSTGATSSTPVWTGPPLSTSTRPAYQSPYSNGKPGQLNGLPRKERN